MDTSVFTLQETRSIHDSKIGIYFLICAVLSNSYFINLHSFFIFRDENFTDQILERQADVIRYLKQHNIQLGMKIIALTDENKALKRSR